MRVVHACTGNMYGGTEAVLSTLARHRHGATELDQQFATCFDARLAEELRGLGAEVEVFGPAKFSRPWTLLAARNKFRFSLLRSKPDIVICHGAWAHAICGPAARRLGIFLTYWQHDLIAPGAVQGVGFIEGWRRSSYRFERIAARTRPDLVIANSHFTAKTTAEMFPGVPVEVVYCPVEMAPPTTETTKRALSRSEVRRELKTPEDAVVIAMTCRLEAYKGHAFLLSALALLRDRPNWIMWIAGGVQREKDRAYLDGLMASAKSLGITDRVFFLGQRSDVPRILNAADVFCQPNIGAEPFGIAFVEAMGAGLPVVTTRMGGAAEIVNDECGLLVPPDDAQALAEALGRLIDDPGLRRSLGAAGPKRARSLCDPMMIRDRLEAVFQSTKAGTKPSASQPSSALLTLANRPFDGPGPGLAS
jgi:glycosyltransferase involved in cell wall biosynthesis